MSDQPTTFAEYELRFAANQHVSGYGIEGVTFHSPCPFCGAPDYATWPVLQAEEAMQQERTCRECGRSARVVFHVNTPDRKQFELVQTGGPDPPAWLQPPPRRIA